MSSKTWMMCALLAAVGCGDDANNKVDNGTPNNVGADTGGSVDMGTAEDAESPVDSGGGGDMTVTTNNRPRPGCGDNLLADVTFDLDEGVNGGQLYARTAWDGKGAWVIYNRPDAMGPERPEQIFAVRVGCDGVVQHGPLRLSDDSGARNYMPVVASRGGLTHVAWVEQPVGMNPNAIKLMVLNDDGTPAFDTPANVTPIGPDGPVSGLTWEPDVAVWADGTGVVAVSEGGFGEFQVALQRYDAMGNTTGNAMIPFTEKGVDQKRPSLAAAADGTIYVAWTRYKPEDTAAGTPEEPERAVFTSIPTGANMAFPAAPNPAKPLSDPNPIARYSRDAGPGGVHFLAFQVTSPSRQAVLVRDGTDFDTAASGTFGSSGWANFRPSVAAGAAGGVLAWYRYNESPLKGVVMVHPFAFDGAIVPGTERVIETETPGIPPYGPDLSWAGGGDYFVTWSEANTAPEARVKGRWVSFD